MFKVLNSSDQALMLSLGTKVGQHMEISICLMNTMVLLKLVKEAKQGEASRLYNEYKGYNQLLKKNAILNFAEKLIKSIEK